MKHVIKTKGMLSEIDVKLPIIFGGVRLGFVINFDMPPFKDGVERIVV